MERLRGFVRTPVRRETGERRVDGVPSTPSTRLFYQIRRCVEPLWIAAGFMTMSSGGPVKSASSSA